ncbi:peptide antibiotic transporter SbmA [Granulosicoccus antarcticus]|uniref:Peptide antibiotic transporter SbmA n=1 Tax=Granulosicoccus antarcticus IMCC3135 TaxID=1192854 RepID=A0A2Z2NV30_9GAMM|nr:peptide antibiotic transporter SbmA [Granulosicoccus antarcticus]ASJ75402.1 Peptide antibiotic transporter SbmA [Granulosicoccus antarcticus IMCC3135]
MFQSFFPRPKVFFLSAVAWFFVCLAIWYGFADGLADQLSLMREAMPTIEGERPPFLDPDKVWVYQFIVLATALFCVAWYFIDRNRWYWWAVCGSAVILLVSYFQVQLGVWLNNWYGDFYDLIQLALSEQGVSKITTEQFYGQLLTALYILVPNIIILVTFAFFTSHYVFRWRTAMNDYYMTHWQVLRNVEGAAQRVQEDTMRFASIMEGLGSAFVSSIMTLIAFLPLLWTLSTHITELPLVGAVNGSLVFLALMSAIFGTVLLALVGYRLPGLEFNNQKVEAAYRKELVYGEDSDERAAPPTIRNLFSDVRRNYFKLYFNYLYFNVFRYAYLQGANFIPLIALGPTFVAGVITFGLYQQISNAFGRVENSFQFLVNSWTTIVELMSIHKRLKTFESRIDTSPQAAVKPSLEL